MTFVIKQRGSRMPMVSEYECPVHGRFEATVDRDENGDPPSWTRCPAVHDGTGTLRRYEDDLEVVVPQGTPCQQPSEHRMSAPRVKARLFEVVRGGWAKPERPTWLDTRELGEGQSLDEFHEKRAAIREEQRKRDVMAFARENHERLIGHD